MKDVLLKEENKGKVFTKKKAKDIIKKDYNPLKVNYRLIYKRRDGLYKMEKEILKEIKVALNIKEKIVAGILGKTFVKVYKKGIEKGFNSRM